MGLFGKSKDDKAQDATIQNLAKTLDTVVKNQNVIIKNQNQIFKDINNIWSWIPHFKQQIESLEKADKQFKAADADMNKRLENIGASLYNAAKQKAETTQGEAQP